MCEREVRETENWEEKVSIGREKEIVSRRERDSFVLLKNILLI